MFYVYNPNAKNDFPASFQLSQVSTYDEINRVKNIHVKFAPDFCQQELLKCFFSFLESAVSFT